MSHFTQVEMNISSTDALVKALQACGVPLSAIEVHEKPQQLFDYQNNATAYRYRDTQDERFAHGDKCHVIVRRGFLGGASNDMGFYIDPEKGTVAFLCDYNRGHTRWNDAWLEQIGNHYAAEEIKDEYADKQCYEVEHEGEQYVFVKMG